ncbi:hypothetical protein RJ641_014867, partial [Dillenia turbinata]
KVKANWELKNCCNHEQAVFLITPGVCAVVILALWRTLVLTPFKLVTVFLYEVSHAIACKLTCGHLRSFILLKASRYMLMKIERRKHVVVYTRSFCLLDLQQKVLLKHGNIQMPVFHWFSTSLKPNPLEFTDLGSSFCGMVLILASTNLLTARIVAGCLAVALLVVPCVAKNVNIFDDLISRRVHSSDAEKFAEVCLCSCNGVGWGGSHLFCFFVEPCILDLLSYLEESSLWKGRKSSECLNMQLQFAYIWDIRELQSTHLESVAS